MTVFDMLAESIEHFFKVLIFLLLISIFSYSKLYADDDIAIEIDNPKFSEKGLDNRLYEIKANKGIQKDNILDLFGVEGKLRTDTGIWIYLNSKRGKFNQPKNLIELSGEITFYTDEYDKFHSDYGLFSIKNDLVRFTGNVKHIKGTSVITSNESIMKNNFNHIIYKGNVSTLYVIE